MCWESAGLTPQRTGPAAQPPPAETASPTHIPQHAYAIPKGCNVAIILLLEGLRIHSLHGTP